MADRFVYHCTLRWSDQDAYGHVNNARFLTLYEEARVALMFAGAQAQGIDSFTNGVVIRRHEIDYLRPVDFALHRATAEGAPTVRIDLWVEQIRAASFTIGYEMYDGDLLVSRARSVLVPFDLAQQAARRLTEQERAFLLGYALDGGTP
ncbi:MULTISPECIES: acyl-CoA thioesterase [unclassified Micromonospora]|uniref:acyl-CoA thioesterase n=1 Tax=unclassified Micromonospora TaxID=2617518 RepID=UPI00332AC543